MTEGNNYKELFYKKQNAWESIDEKETGTMNRFCSEYAAFRGGRGLCTCLGHKSRLSGSARRAENVAGVPRFPFHCLLQAVHLLDGS